VNESLDFLIANFAADVPGVLEAVAVSSDGLLIAMSEGMDRAAADRFAAVTAGLISLAEGAAGLRGGNVHEVVVEMDHAFLFVTRIAGGACLATTAARDSDVGLVGYEMARLVERVGAVLTPALVAELRAALPA
jgi:predicted regulator of Ras-like GTPase activity (Roadblock/LC7/MglB family)